MIQAALRKKAGPGRKQTSSTNNSRCFFSFVAPLFSVLFYAAAARREETESALRGLLAIHDGLRGMALGRSHVLTYTAVVVLL